MVAHLAVADVFSRDLLRSVVDLSARVSAVDVGLRAELIRPESDMFQAPRRIVFVAITICMIYRARQRPLRQFRIAVVGIPFRQHGRGILYRLYLRYVLVTVIGITLCSRYAVRYLFRLSVRVIERAQNGRAVCLYAFGYFDPAGTVRFARSAAFDCRPVRAGFRYLAIGDRIAVLAV